MYNVWQYLSSLVNILSNVESPLFPSWVDRDFKKVPRSGGVGAGAGGPGAAAGGARARGGGAPRGRGPARGMGPHGPIFCQDDVKFSAKFARFRLYRRRSLQVNTNTRFAAFFKIYQILKLKFLKFDKILQMLRHLQFFLLNFHKNC